MAISFLKFFKIARSIETALRHHREGRFDEAEAEYRQVLEGDPDNFDALQLLGALSKQQGRNDEAIELISRAVAIDPSFAPAHNNLGAVLMRQGRREEAIASFKQAISLDPGHAKAYYNLGRAEDDAEEALRYFQKAVSCAPELAEARWAWAMAQLPAVSDAGRDPADARRTFSVELGALTNWFEADPKRMAAGYEGVGIRQPFYLAYHEESNKELLARYGDLCVRLMGEWYRKQRFPSTAARTEGKVRIGIVSAHVREHSVWNAIVRGWLQHIDDSRFDVHLFHACGMQDRHTEFARSRTTSFEQGPRDLLQWVGAIRDKQPDVLIYPEIGMDPMTAKLAALRLAPVQVTTWGHPETSGLPTMDYYLSAEDFEPAAGDGAEARSAQENYTERLIVLPHLGCCYAPLLPARADPDLGTLGIHPGVPLLLCAGFSQKYQSCHDRTLVEIARRLGECQFIFFLGGSAKHWAVLRRRFETAFAHAGLDIEKHVVFIPWQERSRFYGLLQRVDLLLDTIGFSGFNTAMQAVECGLPVVTREGRFMRGRLASGILKRMGMSDLVAQSEEEYVSLAVKLARDSEYREEVRGRIDASRHVLFNDTVPIRALEDFLAGVTCGARDVRREEREANFAGGQGPANRS